MVLFIELWYNYATEKIMTPGNSLCFFPTTIELISTYYEMLSSDALSVLAVIMASLVIARVVASLRLLDLMSWGRFLAVVQTEQ